MHPPPRPRRALRPRAHPRPLPRQLHGALRRRHRRQGRQHAFRRSVAGLHRHGLDAPRHGARRHGDGARLQGALGEARGHDLLRRGLHRQRPVARGDEHGRRPAPAHRLHPREQRLRLLDPERARVRRRPGRARPHLRVPRRRGGRQRRRGRVRGLACCGRARARRRRPDPDRVPDDAHARPRRPRRHELRARGTPRRVGQARPDRALRQASGRRLRLRSRRGRHGPQRGARIRCGVRREGARLTDARTGRRHRRRLRLRLYSARRRPSAVVALAGAERPFERHSNGSSERSAA